MNRPSKKTFLIILFLPFLTFAASRQLRVYLSAHEGTPSDRIISPLAIPEPTAIYHPTPTPVGPPITELDEHIRAAVKKEKGDWSVFVKDLATGQTAAYREHKPYEAASLYKLWVMAETFDKISTGFFKEDDVLSRDIATLNKRFSIDPEDAELTEGTISLSVRDALEKMITVSDNYSALLLAEKMRLKSVSQYMAALDLSESKVGTQGGMPRTTASDMGKFLDLLYRGSVVDRTSSEMMVGLLKRQKLNHKIPKYLPERVEVAHKTGELFGNSHDAGIVYGRKKDYILVIMTDTASPGSTEEKMAKLSKTVYEFMLNEI